MEQFINTKIKTIKTSGIRAFNTLANNFHDVIRFTLGEPDFDSVSEVKDATINAIKDNKTHYAPNNGLLALREAISDYALKTYQQTYSSDEVLVTLGASEALTVAIKTITNPSDEIICFEPAYPAYKPLIEMNQAKYVCYDLKATNFKINKNQLNRLINKNTKAIIINSPNNPSGLILKEDDLQTIYECVKDRHIFIINDDIYTQLVYEKCPSMAKYQDIRKQLIFIQSFSKSYAMSGYRLGFLIADLSIINHFVHTHAYTLSCIPTFIQYGGIKALTSDNSQMLKAYQKRRALLISFFDSHHINYLKPEGAFYLFVDISFTKLNSYDFALDLLDKKQVCVIPGRYFGDDYDNFVRISYSLSEEKIKEGLKRIDEYLKNNDEA